MCNTIAKIISKHDNLRDIDMIFHERYIPRS